MTTQAHWSTRPLSVLVVATVVQVVTVMAGNSMVAIAPEIARRLEVEPSLIGFQVSIVYSGAMIGALFGGPLVLRYGPCRTQQVCVALSALGALVACAPSLWLLALASLLWGLGTGPATPAASHVLNRFTDPARRNLIFSLKQTGVPLGVMAAAFVMPPLTLAGGAPTAYALLAGVAAATAVFLQAVRRHWDDDRTPGRRLGGNPLAGLPMIWRHPLLRWLSASAFCYAFCQLCVTSFTVTMLVTEAGIGLVEAGLLLSLVQFSGVVSRVGFGIWADRVGSALVPLALVGAGTAATCAVTALLEPGWPRTGLWVLLVLLGGTAVGWTGMFVAEVARIAPRGQVGLATGSAIAFNFLGILAGPAIFALAYPWLGSYAHTFGALAVVPLAGAALVLHTLRVERRLGGGRRDGTSVATGDGQG